MNQAWQKDTYFPQNHLAVIPSDSVSLPVQGLVVANSTGTVAAVDKNNTLITYNVVPGYTIPVQLIRVNSTGTTATDLVLIW